MPQPSPQLQRRSAGRNGIRVVEDQGVLLVELDAGLVVSNISERDATAVSLVDENTSVISTLEDLPALLARVAAEGSTNGEGVGRGCACGVN